MYITQYKYRNIAAILERGMVSKVKGPRRQGLTYEKFTIKAHHDLLPPLGRVQLAAH